MSDLQVGEGHLSLPFQDPGQVSMAKVMWDLET